MTLSDCEKLPFFVAQRKKERVARHVYSDCSLTEVGGWEEEDTSAPSPLVSKQVTRSSALACHAYFTKIRSDSYDAYWA
jgi:hypothetical protein